MPTYRPTHDLTWRGKLYLANQVAAIPEDLAIALGISDNPKPETPTPEPDMPPDDVFFPVPRALTIINEGNSPEELAVLPTIGKGSAKVLLSDRPDGGYESLSELPAKIFAPPYNCDLAEIEAYEG